MRAEVIAIGDELISGQRLDTNSQWLSQRLAEIGVEVAFHSTVGDSLEDNVVAFRQAIDRADVVVSTGGLGPTADDLTREALAVATGVELVRDPASLAHIERLFAERGRKMPERNQIQADFPAGSFPIENRFGTAPGIRLPIADSQGADAQGNKSVVFALPGVPAELKTMWSDTVAPAIQSLAPTTRVIRHRRIKCFGVGESQLESMLPDLIRRGRQPSVGITVSEATITLRITAAGADEQDCLTAIEPTVETIRQSLGDLVFGEEDDELQQAVCRLLAERRQTVAVAEGATAGRITQWLADAQQDEHPTMVAGVTLTDLQLLAKSNGGESSSVAEPWSSEAAVASARWIRRLSGADFGMGIGAFPPTPDGPTARVHVAIDGHDRVRKLRFGCASHPAIRISRSAKQALNAFRLALLGRDRRDV